MPSRILPECSAGSTSVLIRVQPGVVLKHPGDSINEDFVASIARHFVVEAQILEILGDHPRIVKYLGRQDKPELPSGLLFAEASHANLQEYLNDKNDEIPPTLRRKWCRQVVESIACIHSQGVIHSDLRPENILVHATTPTSLDIYLCDFGGSTCEKLGLDGGNLPDSGFFDPNSECVSTPATDLFSVASILYTILTGHWPYRAPGGRFESIEAMMDYTKLVDGFFGKQEFPDVSEIWVGAVILKCWMREYTSADDILQALELEMTDEISE
ncbi:kinase-like domain-containing protein [Daldinia decipiens]|uniref:kinase-like domain-containing protein n=1 Tax=Daldinia decipiens TaxID=326647 RepID=UPI0020C33A92|nr:kinase-like domain-containing protein [Daldinia decipiens]KAI1652468.1 kinase-like domain-containing protein [Daldinia decipiens]